jgi:hypothetical protein
MREKPVPGIRSRPPLAVLLVIAAGLGAGMTASAGEPSGDLDLLVGWMTGSFSSAAQAAE